MHTLTNKVIVLRGVNFPAHLCIIKGTEFFDAKTRRYVDFPVTDVLQMMGRAGRPQFDDSGVSVVMVHEPKKNFYRKFLHEPFPVESSLHHQLHNHFNAEIASQSILSLDDCIEYLSWTYYFRRLVMNPSYYGVENSTEAGIREHLVSLAKQIVNELASSRCIALTDMFDISPTHLGRVASLYYIDYRTVGAFDAFTVSSSQKLDLPSVLTALCNAVEFNELPVRHNEEILNAELAKKLPWKESRMDFESPNVKAFLLMQAHFYGIVLPISDYINDTKSVLDQMPRVLNALMDIALQHKRKDIVETLFLISQMIIQGLNPSASELLQLPGIDEGIVSTLKQHKIVKLRDLLKVDSWTSKLEKLIGNRLGRSRSDFVRVLSEVSIFDLSMNIRGANGEPSSESADKSARVLASSSCVMDVIIRRLRGNAKARVYAPKYHRSKSHSYWLMVASSTAVYALKRVESIHSNMTLTFSFQLPEGLSQIIVKLCPDSVMGLDEAIHCQINVLHP